MEMLVVLDRYEDADEEKEENIVELGKEDFISMKGNLGNLKFLTKKVARKWL